LIEGGGEAGAFRRAAHDAGVDGGFLREIGEPRGNEAFAIQGIESF